MNPAHCHKDGQSCFSLPSPVSSLAWSWLTVAASLANRKPKENMPERGDMAVKFQSNSPGPNKAHWRHWVTTDWKLHFLFLWWWRGNPQRENKILSELLMHFPRWTQRQINVHRDPHTQDLFRYVQKAQLHTPAPLFQPPKNTHMLSTLLSGLGTQCILEKQWFLK